MRSTPGWSSSGNMRPASSSSMSPSHSKAVMFLPMASRPPKGMTSRRERGSLRLWSPPLRFFGPSAARLPSAPSRERCGRLRSRFTCLYELVLRLPWPRLPSLAPSAWPLPLPLPRPPLPLLPLALPFALPEPPSLRPLERLAWLLAAFVSRGLLAWIVFLVQHIWFVSFCYRSGAALGQHPGFSHDGLEARRLLRRRVDERQAHPAHGEAR